MVGVCFKFDSVVIGGVVGEGSVLFFLHADIVRETNTAEKKAHCLTFLFFIRIRSFLKIRVIQGYLVSSQSSSLQITTFKRY